MRVGGTAWRSCREVGLDDVSFDFADGGDPDAEARLMTATLRRHHAS